MPLPIALSALLFLQNPTAAPAAAPPSLSLQTPMTVAEPVRIALTPKSASALDDEAWDPLVSGPNLQGYFQWEPGKLHFAGVVPHGSDLLVSIDFGGSGWLVGSEHVEVRLSDATGSLAATVRRLDAAQVSGPRWVDLPGMKEASRFAESTAGPSTTYFASLVDAGLGLCPERPGTRISVRMDAIPSTTPPLDPYIPRVLSPLLLEYMRSVALPTGLRFGVEGAGEYVVPGDPAKLRVTFNGKNDLKLQRIELRGEGYARNLAEIAVPFPPFDEKGRTFVDYRAELPRDESLGFRVLRAKLTGGDGIASLMEASFRVAPVIEVNLVPKEIRSRPQAQTVRVAYYIHNYSHRGVSGEASAVVDAPLGIDRPGAQKFVADGPGTVRMIMALHIPGGVRGSFPVDFHVRHAGEETTARGYVNIR